MSFFVERPFNEFGKQVRSPRELLETRLIRSLAISLGSLAMGLVVLRGAIHREVASDVASEAIGALIVFLGIGALAGAIGDYIVRDGIEDLYRRRVQWYRDGVAELTPDSKNANETTTETSGDGKAATA
ncbi:MAG: hypothetical protein AAF670_20655 [Planctomycetota bacterium]